MADVARLTGLVDGRCTARCDSTAAAGFDLHLIGVQQIRDRLFPGGDVFVADTLLLSRLVAVIAGFRIEIGISRLVPRLEDFLGLVVFVEAARRLLGGSRVFFVLSLAPTGAGLGRGTIVGEFTGPLAPGGLDGRLGIVGFGPGVVVPIGFRERCRSGLTARRLTFTPPPTAAATAAPPTLPWEVSLASLLATMFLRPSSAALTTAEFAGGCGRFGLRRRRARPFVVSSLCRTTRSHLRLGGRVEFGYVQPQSKVVAFGGCRRR